MSGFLRNIGCVVGRHDVRRVRVIDLAVLPTVGLSTGYVLDPDGPLTICWRCGRRVAVLGSSPNA